MSPRLAYQGFSFDRPPNRHWYLLRSEESYTAVILRRETGFSKTHTFYAQVALASIARRSSDSRIGKRDCASSRENVFIDTTFG